MLYLQERLWRVLLLEARPEGWGGQGGLSTIDGSRAVRLEKSLELEVVALPLSVLGLGAGSIPSCLCLASISTRPTPPDLCGEMLKGVPMSGPMSSGR